MNVAFKLKSVVLVCILLLPALAVISCKDDATEPELALYNYGKQPFGDLWVTSSTSPTPIAEWTPTAGDRFAANAGVYENPVPIDPPGITDIYMPGATTGSAYLRVGSPVPTTVSLFFPYPNPAQDAVFFMLALPKDSKVVAWISKASIPGEDTQSGFSERNNLMAGIGQSAVVAVYKETLAAGYHNLRWQGFDASGKPVASGYFVFSVSIDGVQYRQSFVLYRNPAELPPRLRAVVEARGR